MSITDKLSEEVSSIRGIFVRRLSLWQGIALIVSSTIGAGILGLPYAISRSGVMIGFLYIVFLGFLMMILNLMLGSVVSVQKIPLQLTGLAQKYLGLWGGRIMTGISYTMFFGVLVVYLIGQGETLSALFGGSPTIWTIIFAAFGTLMITIGMRTIKIVESVLVIGVLGVIFLIVLLSIPHVNVHNFASYNFAELLFPYGVILFALHGTASIPETYSIMRHKNGTFKRAIICSGVIAILVYAAFALMTVGVTGGETTPIATVGLGKFMGEKAFIFGNVFALLAMGTSFFIVGLSLRDSLVWDYRVKEWLATLAVCVIPFSIFCFGVRNFIAAIDIIGGVLVSLELFLIILIYWRAYERGDLKYTSFHIKHIGFFMTLLILALAVGAVYSVVKLF